MKAIMSHDVRPDAAGSLGYKKPGETRSFFRAPEATTKGRQ